MDETTATYTIPAINYDEFLHEIEKLNRRAERLGVPAIEVEELGFEEEDGEIVAFDVRLTGQAPTVSGWTLVAHLEWREETEDGAGANKVNHILDQALPAHWRTEEPRCDHCEHQRRRTYTYVLRNEAGDEVMVGTTCVADFTGANDPHALASWAELVKKAGQVATYDPDFPRGGSPYVHTKTYMAATVAAIQKYGWTSKSKARIEGTMATVGDVADILAYLREGDEALWREHRIRLNAKYDEAKPYWDKAGKVIEWVRTEIGGKDIGERNDYEHNLYLALAGEKLHERDCGIAASAVAAYNREMGKRQERETERRQSEHVGEVGDRLDLRLKLVFRYDSSSHFGYYGMFKFEDEAGNVYVWWTGALEDAEPSDDVWWVGRGTVKAHEQYKGVRQTVLTRCRLEREEASDV